MTIEWDPAMPERLTVTELRRYRRARAEMLGRLADRLGSGVVVVEM